MVKGSVNEWWVVCSEDGTCPADWQTAISTATKDDFPGCPPPPTAEEQQAETKEGVMAEKKIMEI